MKTIKSIKVERILDTDADTSWIGKYTETWEDGAIDRQEQGDWERGTYRYFVSCNNATYKAQDWKGVKGTEASHKRLVKKYALQDYKRMEAINRGDICFYGVTAGAEILINNTIQRIHSGGLWGIESDSEESYFKEEESNQLKALEEQLLELGFTKAEIAKAVKTPEHATV